MTGLVISCNLLMCLTTHVCLFFSPAKNFYNIVSSHSQNSSSELSERLSSQAEVLNKVTE